MENQNERLLQFRRRDIEQVMGALRAGNSCALIGVDGVGKSMLLKRFLTPTLREYYLPETYDHTFFFVLNSHELNNVSPLSYYRRMASLLKPLMHQYGLPITGENALLIADEDVASDVLFQRVEALIQCDERLLIAFFLDEFDIAYAKIEPQFMRVLKALRYRARGRVCYIIVSNNLPQLICEARTRKLAREAFEELFNRRVIGIKPLGQEDAFMLIDERLKGVALRGYAPSYTSLRRLLFEVTGGHHGLLKTALQALIDGEVQLQERETVASLSEKLLDDETIISKCEQLWNSLSESEQQCLKHLQRGLLSKMLISQQFTNRQMHEVLYSLQIKGLLLESSRSKMYRCFAPLFGSFVMQQISSVAPGIQLDFARQQIWVDGILLPGRLTPSQVKLLRFLVAHAGEICPRQDTTRAVYDEEYNADLDDARLDALVERTRKHIGDDSRAPRFLETVRGSGHRLNEYQGEHF
ncbi:winged helix-turn-helix domain-containing protein [Ktedonospora formicarum]|uniref:OmpR/PhoB-type domain-containing protein n=1 Tax=Ktedonospora formicarum TaxID=2778364 RepID=A0A8J3HSN3_9CHLR|nr:winged helix-turn-helix domain-containing protein [Ktedonospora formicarum]GHO43232.1 hypothetical protein KSX_13950 [Ktedonospora formicarum]